MASRLRSQSRIWLWRVRRLEVTPGFVAALCLLRLLVEPGVFSAFLAAAAAHEAGHLIALWLTGTKVCGMRLGVCDAQILTGTLGYRQEIICALAGPAASVLLCLALQKEMPTCAAISLLLGLFNALPVFPLDGGRAMRAFLRLWLPLSQAEHVSHVLSVAVCALGFAASLICTCVYRMGMAPVLVWGVILGRLLRYRWEEMLDISLPVEYNVRDYEKI